MPLYFNFVCSSFRPSAPAQYDCLSLKSSFVQSDWFISLSEKLVVCYHVPSLPRRKKEEEKTLS